MIHSHSAWLVESTDGSPDVGLRQIGATEVLQRAKDSFDSAIAKLRPAIAQLVDQLTGMENSPTEVEIEFAIKLSAAAGAIIAATGTEANFRVTLNWKRKS